MEILERLKYRHQFKLSKIIHYSMNGNNAPKYRVEFRSAKNRLMKKRLTKYKNLSDVIQPELINHMNLVTMCEEPNGHFN